MMYSKAIKGYEKVLGPDHPTAQYLQDKVRALDSVTENMEL
jgi:hypothetical protein